MVSASTQPPLRPPALLEAAKRSTAAWQDDLHALYRHAKDRFPDVVWDLLDEDAMDAEVEETWGHKAIVYARAPPSFQARYFSFRPPPIASPVPYSTSPTPSLPMPASSALSLSLGAEFHYPASLRSSSPSHGRAISPAPSSTIGTLTRISLNHNPVLFSNELEYLYTGKGLGEAFEFLFDASEKGPEGDVDAEEARVDKLRKDLVFMWRSRLYSDVRIELSSTVSSSSSVSEEETTAVFSSHRFILATRSPYFYDHLITYGFKGIISEPTTLRLPSPPFTPPALHFTLGFLYTGTLNFSNRTYDLDTAFAILSSANYLQLQSLHDEIQARLVQEMLHGLFHAFLEFSEYERITGGKWGTGGCRCRQCARRAPRTLEFAMRPDVKNVYLDRGARRALVGLFGDGWCTPEFADLPQKTKDGLLKGLAKRTTPMNVFPLLFAAHAAMNKLNNVMDTWADGVREMVLTARKVIDDVICNESEKCFGEYEWVDLMENDGQGRFEDGERVEWIMDSVRRGVAEANAGTLYQTLVSSILLRPHPNEPGETMLSSISHIRVQVEQARMDILRWLRRRWIGVRQEGGFDSLESWAVKEISHEIDVPVEDLFNSQPAPTRGPQIRSGLRPSLSKVEDASERDSMSIHSLRASVSNKNVARTTVHQPVNSSGASIRSTTRSVVSISTSSRTSNVSAAPSARSRVIVPSTASGRDRRESRPDSKLAPSANRTVSGASSSQFSMDVDADETESLIDPNDSSAALAQQAASSVASRRTGLAARAPRAPVRVGDSANLTNVQRPRSSAASVASARSHASTIRKTAANSGRSTLRPPPETRPDSTLSISTRSETSAASSAFKTARESITGRSRRISTASTVSTLSTRSGASRSPHTQVSALPSTLSSRSRRSSEASVSSAGATATSRARKQPSVTAKAHLEPNTPIIRKSPSTASIKSTSSTAAGRRAVAKKSPEREEKRKSSKMSPSMPSKENVNPDLPINTSSVLTVKGKSRADTLTADTRSVGSGSVGKSDTGSATTRRTLKRKESNDTITVAIFPSAEETGLLTVGQNVRIVAPRGATLDIGIPCIISSKRKRFRAFARYIGEVEGELGPWVGVEVPVGEEWDDDQIDDRLWNDGSWGGIQYFEVGASSDWGDDDRASRRHRTDWVNGQKGAKREGDQLVVDRKKRLRSASPSVSDISSSEYRGLFVRPQQVLYVVDAVGSDF